MWCAWPRTARSAAPPRPIGWRPGPPLSVVLRAEFWDDLVRSDAPDESPTLTVTGLYDPR